jgi:hypothetical protein
VRQLALLQSKGLGRWVSFQPSQAPLGLIVSGWEADETLGGYRNLIKRLPGFAVQCSLLQQDPDYSSLQGISSTGNVEVSDYIVTSRLRLQGTYEEYWRGRSSNLRHNLERQLRRLGEQGKSLILDAQSLPERMADGVREHARLESQGWKAGTYTAITETNAQGAFYREMLEHFASRGEAVTYQLLLDGQIIASDLCLRRNRMLVVLKTAYDESIRGFSPALLMHRYIFQKLYSEQEVDVVEFYGRVMDWHTKWTKDYRTLFHVNLYRNGLVRRSTGLIKSSKRLVSGRLPFRKARQENHGGPAKPDSLAAG